MIYQAKTAEQSKLIVMRHLSLFLNYEVETLLAHYTEESVLITPDETYTNLEEIRSFFLGFNRHFPHDSSEFVLEKVVTQDNLVYILWNAKSPTLHVPMGSDTFLIQNGKIHQQTFADVLNFTEK